MAFAYTMFQRSLDEPHIYISQADKIHSNAVAAHKICTPAQEANYESIQRYFKDLAEKNFGEQGYMVSWQIDAWTVREYFGSQGLYKFSPCPLPMGTGQLRQYIDECLSYEEDDLSDYIIGLPSCRAVVPEPEQDAGAGEEPAEAEERQESSSEDEEDGEEILSVYTGLPSQAPSEEENVPVVTYTSGGTDPEPKEDMPAATKTGRTPFGFNWAEDVEDEETLAVTSRAPLNEKDIPFITTTSCGATPDPNKKDMPAADKTGRTPFGFNWANDVEAEETLAVPSRAPLNENDIPLITTASCRATPEPSKKDMPAVNKTGRTPFGFSWADDVENEETLSMPSRAPLEEKDVPFVTHTSCGASLEPKDEKDKPAANETSRALLGSSWADDIEDEEVLSMRTSLPSQAELKKENVPFANHTVELPSPKTIPEPKVEKEKPTVELPFSQTISEPEDEKENGLFANHTVELPSSKTIPEPKVEKEKPTVELPFSQTTSEPEDEKENIPFAKYTVKLPSCKVISKPKDKKENVLSANYIVEPLFSQTIPELKDEKENVPFAKYTVKLPFSETNPEPKVEKENVPFAKHTMELLFSQTISELKYEKENVQFAKYTVKLPSCKAISKPKDKKENVPSAKYILEPLFSQTILELKDEKENVPFAKYTVKLPFSETIPEPKDEEEKEEENARRLKALTEQSLTEHTAEEPVQSFSDVQRTPWDGPKVKEKPAAKRINHRTPFGFNWADDVEEEEERARQLKALTEQSLTEQAAEEHAQSFNDMQRAPWDEPKDEKEKPVANRGQRTSFGFNWADDVEEEEEEHARRLLSLSA